MSSDDNADNPVNGDGIGDGADNDSLASKLSKELSNWKRRRTVGRPQRPDGPSFQSGPARTIKVRGHETLVIRKPKGPKQAGTPTPDSDRGDG
jgi:hypothetical protein